MPVKDWVHPFIDSLSDAIVEDLSEGAAWVRKLMSVTAPKVKDVEYIQSAMQYYRDNQLPHDEPMKALIDANKRLRQRVWNLRSEKKESALEYTV